MEASHFESIDLDEFTEAALESREFAIVELLMDLKISVFDHFGEIPLEAPKSTKVIVQAKTVLGSYITMVKE